MVQFLSIIFLGGDFFNFCWVFQKFPFFVSLCINGNITHQKLFDCTKIVELGNLGRFLYKIKFYCAKLNEEISRGC